MPRTVIRDDNGFPMVAQYNASLPTYNSGDAVIPQTDANGRLITSTSGTSAADQSTFTPATSSGTIVEGVYQSTPDTIANNKAAAVLIDSLRRLTVTQGTLIAGEDLVTNVLKVEERFSYANIITNATTTVKSAAGFLHSIMINNPMDLTTTKLTMSIYDNTAGSGTSIGVVTVPAGSATLTPIQLWFDVTFNTGLTIVTAGPTAAANVTVSYR